MQTRIDEVQPYGDDMKQLALLRTVCVGAAVLSLAHFSWTAWSRLGGTDFDDAFIFIRYAKHWLSGAGFSWNAADGTAYGITSFLHLFVVTLLRALTDLSDAGVLTAVSFVAALLSCVVLIVLGFLSVENAGFRKTRMPLLVVPCLLLGSSLGYHSVTGMETTLSLLANALLACCVVLWSRNRSLRGLALCLLSAYVSFLTRPDNGLYAWLLPPLFLVASDRRLWRYSLSYAFLFVLVLVCDGALKKALLGDFVPLPFFAKSSGFYQGYLGTSKWNAMGEMLSFFREALPFMLLAVCTASRRAIPRLAAIAVPMLVTFAYYLTVTQIMGWHSRYYYPSLPFLVLGAWWPWIQPGAPTRVLRRRAVTLFHGECSWR